MKKFDFGNTIIVTFKTPNGNTWDECHYASMTEMFMKAPDVQEIREKDTDKLIYSKEA